MKLTIAFVLLSISFAVFGNWQKDPNWTQHKTGYVPTHGPHNHENTVTVQPVPALPAAYDWRAVVPLSAVKNQGDCGSCWAFGTTAELEEALRIFKVSTDILSEQELVSCAPFDGCNGGDFANAYQQSPGQSLDSEFPYSAQDERCPSNLSHKYQLQSWSYIGNDPDRVSAIKTAVL